MKNATSFWYDNFDEVADQYDTKKHDIEYLLRLNNIRRAIANFVSHATNRDIPVRFSTGQQSYAAVGEHGEEFIVISAEVDPRRFDAQVGVALHEASHMMWSRKTVEPESMNYFKMLGMMKKNPGPFFSDDLLLNATKVGHTLDDVKELVDFTMNVIEDRRIDGLMYRQAVGYRPYYEEMYKKLWHSEEVSKTFDTADVRIPTVFNYKFHLCYMTNDSADPNALPGLKKMLDKINLDNIDRFGSDPVWNESWWATNFMVSKTYQGHAIKKLPEFMQVVLYIVEEIYKNSVLDEKEVKNKKGDGKLKKWLLRDKNNLDSPGKFRKMTAEEYEEFKQMVEEAFKATKGEQDKKELDKQQETELEQLDASHVQLKESGIGIGAKFKAKCIVYKKLTKELMNSPNFIFSGTNRYSSMMSVDDDLRAAVEEGSRLGFILASKLKVIADEFPMDYTRKSRGHLDKRLVHTLGYDNENIFHHTIIERRNPVLVHLTVDSSGSMCGTKWRQSIKLAATLARMAEQVKTINFTLSFRCSNNQLVHILMAYDSRVDDFTKVRAFFPGLVAAGGTPEGMSYETIKQYMLEDKTPKKYFINISDGQPSFAWSDGQQSISYQGDVAHKHTAEQVQELKASNIEVLSYFVSGGDNWYFSDTTYDKTAFQRMYGSSATFINAESVSDIARTMNKLFLGSQTINQ